MNNTLSMLDTIPETETAQEATLKERRGEGVARRNYFTA